mmetsp:Transcript_5259/g.20874  ORF Transcript_5259/g.20874 Transcript_5259/m.20874 type:complete len:281 (+) Transcript_5259:130-972(+)
MKTPARRECVRGLGHAWQGTTCGKGPLAAGPGSEHSREPLRHDGESRSTRYVNPYVPVSTRYMRMSSILVSTSPCFSAKTRSSGRRAMSCESSVVISQSTPAGAHPASRARSTLASVCPCLTRTPPSLALSGKMCPGRQKSEALDSTLASRRSVSARSLADMPVDTLSLASTVTVNAVALGSSFFPTICGSSSSSRRSDSSATQITPLVWRTKKPIVSAVACSAAMMRSPSFSRFSSSTTTTTLPFLISSKARSTLSLPNTHRASRVASSSPPAPFSRIT